MPSESQPTFSQRVGAKSPEELHASVKDRLRLLRPLLQDRPDPILVGKAINPKDQKTVTELQNALGVLAGRTKDLYRLATKKSRSDIQGSLTSRRSRLAQLEKNAASAWEQKGVQQEIRILSVAEAKAAFKERIGGKTPEELAASIQDRKQRLRQAEKSGKDTAAIRWELSALHAQQAVIFQKRIQGKTIQQLEESIASRTRGKQTGYRTSEILALERRKRELEKVQGAAAVWYGEARPDELLLLRQSIATLRIEELTAIVASLDNQIDKITKQKGNPTSFTNQRAIVQERLSELQNLASLTDPVTIGHRIAAVRKYRDATGNIGDQRKCDVELEMLHQALQDANRIQTTRATAQERITIAKAQLRRRSIEAIYRRLFGTPMDEATWATIPARATAEAVEAAWSKKLKPKEEKARPEIPKEAPFAETFLSATLDLRLPEQGATDEQKKAIQLTRLIQRDGRTISFGMRLTDAEFGIRYTQPLDELPGLIERESGCYEGMIAFLTALGVPITDFPTPENAFSETDFTQAHIDHFVNKTWRGVYRKLARAYHPDYLSPKDKPSNHAAWAVLAELQNKYPTLTQNGLETLALTIQQSLEQMNSLFTNDSMVGRERPRYTDSVRTFFAELSRAKQALA